MSIDTVSPLRQRVIEEMNARKLGTGTQRGHIRSCKQFAPFLKRSPDTRLGGGIRRFQLFSFRNRIRGIAFGRR
jgi:integrase/recombinase XerD